MLVLLLPKFDCHVLKGQIEFVVKAYLGFAYSTRRSSIGVSINQVLTIHFIGLVPRTGSPWQDHRENVSGAKRKRMAICHRRNSTANERMPTRSLIMVSNST